MDIRDKKSTHSLFLLFFTTVCVFLLAACEDRNTFEEIEQDEIIIELDGAHNETSLSAGGQKAISNQYESFSVIGQTTKTEMVSSKYKLNATLVVPAHIPN